MAMATPRKTTKDPSVSLGDSSINESPRHSDVSDVSQMNDTSPDSMGFDASPMIVTSPRIQKWRFICPKEPEKDKDEANAKTCNALDQVSDTAHFDEEGKCKTATLYVGNLEFKASIDDLFNALSLSAIFKRIRVEKVTIPQRNGRSLGYASIKLSWAVGALVKMSDSFCHPLC